MIHTEKAKKFIKGVENELQMQQVAFDDAIKNNFAYLYSTKENPFRNEFLTNVTEKMWKS